MTILLHLDFDGTRALNLLVFCAEVACAVVTPVEVPDDEVLDGLDVESDVLVDLLAEGAKRRDVGEHLVEDGLVVLCAAVHGILQGKLVLVHEDGDDVGCVEA